MNATDLIIKSNATAKARAQALAVLLERYSYRADDGHVIEPGDPDYQPSQLADLGEGLGAELHAALVGGNDDGLAALLDRWWSANEPADDEAKSVGRSFKALGEKLDQLHGAIDPNGFLIQKVRDRPVGVPSAKGLLKQ